MRRADQPTVAPQFGAAKETSRRRLSRCCQAGRRFKSQSQPRILYMSTTHVSAVQAISLIAYKKEKEQRRLALGLALVKYSDRFMADVKYCNQILIAKQ